MADRWTIVTAADAAYFPLLQGLLASIWDAATVALAKRPDIHVLDLGLAADQRQWLEPRVTGLIVPDWDGTPADVERVRNDLGPAGRAQTSRPHLPRYIPGYETYLWLDADTWVQRWEAIDWYLAAAKDGAIAVTPQLDRCFRCSLRIGPHVDVLFDHYRTFLGDQVASGLVYRLPQINSGAFALRGDSDVWTIWQKQVAQVLSGFAARNVPVSHLFEQIALNIAIYSDGAAVYFLPGLCNWPTGEAMPLLDSQRKLLVEPALPHQPLGIVHLIMEQMGTAGKQAVVSLTTTDGRTVNTAIDFLTIRQSLLGLPPIE
jgi:hypothetical protein